MKYKTVHRNYIKRLVKQTSSFIEFSKAMDILFDCAGINCDDDWIYVLEGRLGEELSRYKQKLKMFKWT